MGTQHPRKSAPSARRPRTRAPAFAAPVATAAPAAPAAPAATAATAARLPAAPEPSTAAVPAASATPPAAGLSGLFGLSRQLYGEWARVMLGLSEREVPAKDPRFADPAWRDHPMYKRLGQGYLAFCQAVDRLAESRPDWRGRERARFLGGVVTSSLAPTNTLLGNPAALKRVFETGGASLVDGTKNMLSDLVHKRGLPSQVS